MAPSETAPGGGGRPRPWLLAAFAAALLVFLVTWLWPGNPAAPPARPSNGPRPAAGGAADARIDPAQLDVRLEALEAPAAEGEGSGRNPFRFQPKPSPAPAASPPALRPVNPPRDVPAGPPGPPPIGERVKFIGIVEKEPGLRVAAFSDCRMTTHAAEGGIVFGQYRLVSIGVESVVMEYLDGRGRTTIRLSGLDCVGK